MDVYSFVGDKTCRNIPTMFAESMMSLLINRKNLI